MLYTRNAFHFRKYFKEQRSANFIDLNFIGALHKPINKPPVEGFASLTVGNREDVGKYLSTVALNVAADDQAIYELIQNADDSKSSFFSVSYNEKYLLCINNGNYFSDNDMSAIINVAGNFKEGEDIGTFGIGFKILHRLVGKDDGRDEIINDYYGPIIFSWNKPSQFEKFINGDPIIINGLGAKGKENYDYEKDKENAWLVKILYTCFPSHYKEPVRIGDYETRESKFDEAELLEMRTFLEKVLEDTNIKGEGRRQLQNGSIFFLRLGEGKSKFLDDGIDKIKSGLSHSIKFLNSLKKIYINGKEIQEQKIDFYGKTYSLDSEEFTKINPKNKKRDIKYTFAFYKDYRRAESLRNGLVPNFYTFFSMDEEKNGLNFLLHCNAFDMSNNRRHLQSNSQINQELLPIIANDITEYIEKQKDKNRELFLTLYANLLLSNEPKNKPHINIYFFKFLKDYLIINIPTSSGYSNCSQNVKIKSTYLPINPGDFGCPEIEWFAWQNEKVDKIIIDEARNSEKLRLDKWDIIDLLKYAIEKDNIQLVNDWVKQANEKHFNDTTNKDYTYLSLIQEIDKHLTERNFPIISQIKLFKFSDGNYYSINEIFVNPDVILIYDKVANIKQELRAIGIDVSNLDISYKKEGSDSYLYANFLKFLSPIFNEETLFDSIAKKTKENNLRPKQKHSLFFAIAEFKRVGPESLKDLELFKDMQEKIHPLRTLLKGTLQVPTWLSTFKISLTEYVAKLDEYLVKDKDIYQSIIYKNWDFLIGLKPNLKDFYTQVTEYYKQNTENIKLEKLPCVFTNEGFKTPEQVFFNTNLNHHNFDDLQNAIFKITSKPTPNKLIFSFLTDDSSPFKISRNDTLSSLISANYVLSYSETSAILAFAKTNKERLFSAAYIVKQTNDFLLAEHSQSVFQYYSSRQEINELLSNHPNFKFFPQEFNANQFSELGIWQDKDLYMKIIQTVDFSENLLPIVRECDKEVQLAYLDKLENFSLHEGKIYDKSSFEHRCLKLAIDCYDSNFQKMFAHKILINNSIRIKDIAVKDDINFEDITLSLANVLPEYKGVSDIITKIINQFTDITNTELSEKVFPINNKKKEEIYSELIAKFSILQNIEQFAFMLYYSKQTGKMLFTNQSLTALSNIDILQFAYKQNFTELNNYVDLSLQNKIYPSDLGIQTENLPLWALNWIEGADNLKKLDFISKLGVYINQSTIWLLRNYFVNKTKFDLNDIAKDKSLSDGKLLINTLLFLKEKGISLSDEKQYLVLKEIERVVNSNGVNDKNFTIKDNYDDEEIINNSKVSDKKSKEYQIFLYNGKLPKVVSIIGIDDYVFYRYNDGDYFVNHFDIYINEVCDLKATLEKVVSDADNGFTYEDLWKIFNENEPEIDNPFKDISLEDEEFIRSIIKGDFELNEKLDANITAKIKTLLRIRNEYNLSKISDKGRFIKADSDEILVRSAQNGLLYLDVYHWGRLNETNVRLSVYTKNEVEIYNSQEELIQFTKPQNNFGIVRMPIQYGAVDYNSLGKITDKGKWHFVFIVNENTKAAQNYKEVMNIDDYNF